jgi:pilus assembly protein CpaF
VRLIGARKNGIIAGGTGSGKTTLMKALLDHVPLQERLIVIEQPAELKIAHPNAVRWEAVAAIPGQVAVTPSQLVAAALRHRPDRIIMGEIRDECGYDLLQAMNTGHGGTLSTLHADSALDALDRLADMALSARTNLDQQFIRSQTGKAVDFVLYCERDSTGRRRVRELITVRDTATRTSASRRRKSTGLPPRRRHEFQARTRADGNANRRHGYDKPSWAR